MQTTFVLVKPDGVARRLVGEIIGRIERKGLAISHLNDRIAPLELCQKHYIEHQYATHYERITQGLCEGPVLYFQVSGINAVGMMRKMIGNELTMGTIRGDFAYGLPHQNVIHASDSEESAKREIALWYTSS